ncbi:MAG: hypothetical protein ACREM8_13890, partial [Vulcanimicrobiaceae bacterium]
MKKVFEQALVDGRGALEFAERDCFRRIEIRLPGGLLEALFSRILPGLGQLVFVVDLGRDALDLGGDLAARILHLRVNIYHRRMLRGVA